MDSEKSAFDGVAKATGTGLETECAPSVQSDTPTLCDPTRMSTSDVTGRSLNDDTTSNSEATQDGERLMETDAAVEAATDDHNRSDEKTNVSVVNIEAEDGREMKATDGHARDSEDHEATTTEPGNVESETSSEIERKEETVVNETVDMDSNTSEGTDRQTSEPEPRLGTETGHSDVKETKPVDNTMNVESISSKLDTVEPKESEPEPKVGVDNGDDKMETMAGDDVMNTKSNATASEQDKSDSEAEPRLCTDERQDELEEKTLGEDAMEVETSSEPRDANLQTAEPQLTTGIKTGDDSSKTLPTDEPMDDESNVSDSMASVAMMTETETAVGTTTGLDGVKETMPPLVAMEIGHSDDEPIAGGQNEKDTLASELESDANTHSEPPVDEPKQDGLASSDVIARSDHNDQDIEANTETRNINGEEIDKPSGMIAEKEADLEHDVKSSETSGRVEVACTDSSGTDEVKPPASSETLKDKAVGDKECQQESATCDDEKEAKKSATCDDEEEEQELPDTDIANDESEGGLCDPYMKGDAKNDDERKGLTTRIAGDERDEGELQKQEKNQSNAEAVGGPDGQTNGYSPNIISDTTVDKDEDEQEQDDPESGDEGAKKTDLSNSDDDGWGRPWRNSSVPKPTKQRSWWTTADTDDYLTGYPGKEDYPQLKDNLDFYQNKIPSVPNGDYIDVIHKKWWGKYDKLEQHHSYIQWLFPIRETGLNWQAQELQLHEAEAICQDKVAHARVLKSYEMMLDFYGMKLEDKKTGKISRAKNWKGRYANLNRSMHNYLRITRILKCLGELDYEHLKFPFVQFCIQEAFETGALRNVARSCKDYWIYVIKDDRKRGELEDLVTALSSS